jgi:ketosteroid isomerase-like protein
MILVPALEWGGMPADERTLRAIVDGHWVASAAGDLEKEHDIYWDDAICDYPQSGERIRGRQNIQAVRAHHPAKPSGFNVRRVVGRGDFWVSEYIIVYEGKSAYTVSIMEFRGEKVMHETQYFADPFEAPAWRAQWVERMD